MEWHYQYLHSSSILAVLQWSFVLNYIHCFEWWCQKFLPEFSSISVALCCSPLTLFRGGSGSFPRERLFEVAPDCELHLYWFLEDSIRRKLLKPDVKFACSLLSSRTGTLCLLRTTLKFKVQRRPAKWQNLCILLLLSLPITFYA